MDGWNGWGGWDMLFGGPRWSDIGVCVLVVFAKDIFLVRKNFVVVLFGFVLLYVWLVFNRCDVIGEWGVGI